MKTINNLQLTIKSLWSTVKSQMLTVKREARGFTLVEMLIYMGILVILITVLSGVFASIIDVQLESKATSSVDQDSRFIISRLIYDMQSAGSIASPSAGVTGTVLRIAKSGENYTYSLDQSGNLQLTNNSGTENFNGYDTSVSGLSFQRIGNGSSTDTVRVTFTLTSKTKKTTGSQTETKTFQTTVGLN